MATTDDIAAADSLDASRHGRRGWGLAGYALAAVAVVAAVLLVVLHIDRYTRIGPVDELQHIDYVLKSPTVVRQGELLGQEAMNEEACRGIDAGFVPPACGTGPYSPGVFQESGFNTASIHPPTYYFLTKVASLPLQGLLSLEPVTAARLVGALWLAVGLFLMVLAGRRLRIPLLPLAGVAALVGSMPVVVYYSATVTPDAASLTVGSGALLLVLAAESATGWRRWLCVVLAGVLTAIVKVQNLAVAGVLGLYLLWRIRSGRGADQVADDVGEDTAAVAVASRSKAGRKRSHLMAATALGAVALVAVLAWSRIVDAVALLPAADIPMNARFSTTEFPWTFFADSVATFLPPANSYYPADFLWPGLQFVQRILVAVLLTGCVIAGWFTVPADSRVTALARSVTVIGLFGPCVLVVANYVLYGSAFQVPERYGVALLPIIGICVAAAAKARWMQWGLVALAVAQVGAVAFGILQ